MAIKPPVLQYGDTIGIVTLGSPLAPSIINERIMKLRNSGFEVVLRDSVYAQTGFLAGSPEMIGQDLMNMFANTKVKMILSKRGGVWAEGNLPFLEIQYI